MPRSTGHMEFIGGYEYFQDSESLFRALTTNRIDGGGFRLGADWMCSRSFSTRFVNRMKAVAAEGRHP